MTANHKWFSVQNEAKIQTSDINIYEQIGKDFYSEDGVSAKEFAEAIKAIPADHEINVHINSRGGNVWDGMAIYNTLQRRRDRVTVYVDGIAASIAAVIACAGKKTICNDGAMMMIHPPTVFSMDSLNADECRALAIKLEIHARAIAAVISEKTGKTQDAILAKMNAGETWMTADEAKDFGICDEISGVTATAFLNEAKAFDFSNFRHVPEKLNNNHTRDNVSNSAKFMNARAITQSESVRNALTEIQNNVSKRGGESAFDTATDRARITSGIYAESRDKIIPVLNAAAVNTIDAGLKRVLILQETVRDFATRVLALRLFSTVFDNVALEGTDTVDVPYYPLQGAASQDFVDGDGTGGTGYQFGQATNTNSKAITVNKRKYQPIDYSSNQFRRQPWFDAVRLGKINAEKLGVDCLLDILSVFTPANYPTVPQADPTFNPNLALPGAAYDSNQIADLKTVATNLNWPDGGRSLICGTTVDNALGKDPAYKLALNIGTTDVIQQGKFPRISGFDYATMPGFPANGCNLQGLIAFASALAAAFAPVAPAQGVRQQLVSYDIATDLASGISLNHRHWGVAQADRDFEVIESAYGYAPIIAKAAQLLTHP